MPKPPRFVTLPHDPEVTEQPATGLHTIPELLHLLCYQCHPGNTAKELSQPLWSVGGALDLDTRLSCKNRSEFHSCRLLVLRMLMAGVALPDSERPLFCSTALAAGLLFALQLVPALLIFDLPAPAERAWPP